VSWIGKRSEITELNDDVESFLVDRLPGHESRECVENVPVYVAEKREQNGCLQRPRSSRDHLGDNEKKVRCRVLGNGLRIT